MNDDAEQPAATNDSDATSQVVDVVYPFDLTSIGMIILVTLLAMAAFFFAYYGLISFGVPRPLLWIDLSVFVLLLFGIACLVVLGKRQFERKRIRQKLAADVDATLPQILPRILDIARSMGPKKTMRLVAEQLAQRPLNGVVLRVGRKDQLDPLLPVPFKFEPRRLCDLADLDAPPPADLCPDDPLPASSKSPRGVHRTIMLKGGWIFAGIFIFNWVARLIESIANRRLHPMLIFWTLALLGFACVPADASWLSNRQYFVLPGGLLLRKGSWFKKNSTLTVFSRSTSFALLYPLWFKQWTLVVSDGRNTESIIGLKPELELAVRAWLSPHQPPPLEQLSDLA